MYFSRLMCSPNFSIGTIEKASVCRTFTSVVRLIYHSIDGSIYCFIAALKLFLMASISSYFLWTQIKCHESLQNGQFHSDEESERKTSVRRPSSKLRPNTYRFVLWMSGCSLQGINFAGNIYLKSVGWYFE